MVMCCPQQLQVNGIDVVTKGQKARRAIVYGIDGVLQPVQRNCDEVETVFSYVSNLMTHSVSTAFEMLFSDID